jgi:hypothetical protein
MFFHPESLQRRLEDYCRPRRQTGSLLGKKNIRSTSCEWVNQFYLSEMDQFSRALSLKAIDEHVAEERALLDRVVRATWGVAHRVKPLPWHVLPDRVPVSSAKQRQYFFRARPQPPKGNSRSFACGACNSDHRRSDPYLDRDCLATPFEFAEPRRRARYTMGIGTSGATFSGFGVSDVRGFNAANTTSELIGSIYPGSPGVRLGHFSENPH